MPTSNYQTYTTRSKELIGRVLAVKKNLPPTLAENFINDALRTISDRKTNWSGLFQESVLFLPSPYTTGNITLTQNSTTVTGSGTSWPVADMVNTTVGNPISRTGVQTVVPLSMENITVDSLLYIDSAGTPEIVAVKEVTPTSFVARFNQFHNNNFTIQASSMANRQLRVSNQAPIYTIRAVTSATTLIINNPWFNDTLTGTGYQIQKMYCTLDPAIKSIVAVVDQAQGIPPLRVNLPVQYLNFNDPQRTATGYPQVLAARGPDENGNMQYEVWPATQSQRQLRVMYYTQPPKISNDDDYITLFVNPTTVFYYAAAMALNTKVEENDMFFDPGVAKSYMTMFENSYNSACLAEQERGFSDFQWDYGPQGIGGADWARSHAIFDLYL